jgi:dimethylglycine dehydrogenase
MHALDFEASDVDPFYSHTVFQGNEAVGLVTSGAYGHRLQRSVGLAYFRQPVDFGDELKASISGRLVKVVIRRM